MADEERLKLLRSVKLLHGASDEQLETLSQFLAPETHAHDATIFAEGTKGDDLYFIASGHVRIAKKLLGQEGGEAFYKELAILGPGDCFGEMAIIEAVSRSADAIASGETVLLRLGREDLNRWLKASPAMAMGFFARLVQVLSGRLRRSSNELTLLFDLSHLLLEPFTSPKDLLDKVMRRLAAYLPPGWCSGAYVYNQFNDEMDLVDVEGDFPAVKDGITIDMNPRRSDWLDARTFQVLFPGQKRLMGFVVFNHAKPLDAEEQNEYARTFSTAARLITSALENIGYRTEEELRARLQTNIRSSGF